MKNFPELLAPAGNFEKLKMAVLYGADAVYLGGHKYSLRNSSDNFSMEECREAVAFAHGHQVKVYVVVNGFLIDDDLCELPSFFKFLESIAVDALIISDIGVIKVARDSCQIPIHISTQASVVNAKAALVYKNLGAKRIVLGREATIEDAIQIKAETGLEVEMFIHGSMCMAFSGHCVISNYTQGRDSNRGGCAHSCRFEYELNLNSQENESEKIKAFFMSSKDLKGLEVLEKMIEANIDSFKIEGRNKSMNYAATVTKVYSEALLYYKENGHFLSEDLKNWAVELEKVSHRDYISGNLIDYAEAESIFDKREADEVQGKIIGTIMEIWPMQNEVVVEVYSAIHPRDQIEILPFIGPVLKSQIINLYSMGGEEILRTKPGTLVRMKLELDLAHCSPSNIVRV